MELDEKREDPHGGPANRFPSLHSHESPLSPSRAALGLSADAGCSSAVDLRSERRRKSICLIACKSGLESKAKEETGQQERAGNLYSAAVERRNGYGNKSNRTVKGCLGGRMACRAPGVVEKGEGIHPLAR